MANKASKKFVRNLVDRIKITQLVVVLWVIVSGCYLIIATINNSSASKGGGLENMEREKQQLRLENQILENQIASYSSLLYISHRASQMGFVETKKVVWLK